MGAFGTDKGIELQYRVFIANFQIEYLVRSQKTPFMAWKEAALVGIKVNR